jgi:hypothetical protein
LATCCSAISQRREAVVPLAKATLYSHDVDVHSN